MLSPLPKGAQTKYLKLFWLKIFFHLPLVSMTPLVHLELRIFTQIFEKKLKRPLREILRSLGETDSWKNLKSKISWHCPFKGAQVCDFHLCCAWTCLFTRGCSCARRCLAHSSTFAAAACLHELLCLHLDVSVCKSLRCTYHRQTHPGAEKAAVDRHFQVWHRLFCMP